jgi:hypothetical protein
VDDVRALASKLVYHHSRSNNQFSMRYELKMLVADTGRVNVIGLADNQDNITHEACAKIRLVQRLRSFD